MNIYLDKDFEERVITLKNKDKSFNASQLFRDAFEKYIKKDDDTDNLKDILSEIRNSVHDLQTHDKRNEILNELQDYINALDDMEKTKTSISNELMLEPTDDKKVEKIVEMDI